MTNILFKINNSLKSNPDEFIALCEETYKKQIEKLAQTILLDPKNKILMISGPSGSGKTTTAHILKTKLEEKGHKTPTGGVHVLGEGR